MGAGPGWKRSLCPGQGLQSREGERMVYNPVKKEEGANRDCCWGGENLTGSIKLNQVKTVEGTEVTPRRSHFFSVGKGVL